MSKETIAVIGGTGVEGSGLALRWAAAGYPIIIGSRSAQKAENAAAELTSRLPAGSASLTGMDNGAAAAAGEIVVLSVPYSAQEATIQQIHAAAQGKVLITVGVPLKPPKVSIVWQPAGGSAAQEAQTQLGDEVRVVAAFQNISAVPLQDLDWQPNCDVLITGDSREAKRAAIRLAEAAGFFALDAGALANATVVEGLTALLIAINIRNKVKDSGIRITGIGRD